MAPSTGGGAPGGRTCLQGPVLHKGPDYAQMTLLLYHHLSKLSLPPSSHHKHAVSPWSNSPLPGQSISALTHLLDTHSSTQGQRGGGPGWGPARGAGQKGTTAMEDDYCLPCITASAPTPSKVRGPASAHGLVVRASPQGFGDTVRLRHQGSFTQHVPSSRGVHTFGMGTAPPEPPPEAGTWVGLLWPC